MKKIFITIILSVKVMFGYANLGMYSMGTHTETGVNIIGNSKDLGSIRKGLLTRKYVEVYLNTDQSTDTFNLTFNPTRCYLSNGIEELAVKVLYRDNNNNETTICLGDDIYNSTVQVWSNANNNGTSQIGYFTFEYNFSDLTLIRAGSWWMDLPLSFTNGTDTGTGTFRGNFTVEEYANLKIQQNAIGDETLGSNINDYSYDMGNKNVSDSKQVWLTTYLSKNTNKIITLSADNAITIDSEGNSHNALVQWRNNSGSYHTISYGNNAGSYAIGDSGPISNGSSLLGQIYINSFKDNPSQIPAGGFSTTIELTMTVN